MGNQQQPRQRGLVGSLRSILLLPLPICVAAVRILRRGLRSLDRTPTPRTRPYNRLPSQMGATPASRPQSPQLQQPPASPPQLFGFPRSFAMVAAVVILLAGIGVGWVLGRAFAFGPSGTAAVATHTPFLLVPVRAATPIRTPPAPVTSPTLGGTEDTFIVEYGAPSSHLTWQSTIAGQAVKIVVHTLQPDHTADGQVHIYLVDVTVPDDALGRETWNAQTANAIAAAFFPSDAKHLRDGPGAQKGEADHIYHSDELAATFHADVFTSVSGGKTDPPGTFHVECHALPPGAANFGECYLSVGTQF